MSLELFWRVYGRMIWRWTALAASLAVLVVGTETLYSVVFINSLAAQNHYSPPRVTRGPTQDMDPALRDMVVRNDQRLDIVSSRVASLESLRPETRLTVIEGKLDAQSWFLKIIFAAAAAQFVSYFGKAVLWAAGPRKSRSGTP